MVSVAGCTPIRERDVVHGMAGSGLAPPPKVAIRFGTVNTIPKYRRRTIERHSQMHERERERDESIEGEMI